MLTNAEQAAQYRAKAENLRAMAQDLVNEGTRFELWSVAAEYDRIADRAERRPPELPAGMEEPRPAWPSADRDIAHLMEKKPPRGASSTGGGSRESR